MWFFFFLLQCGLFDSRKKGAEPGGEKGRNRGRLKTWTMGGWDGDLTSSAVMKISRGDSTLKPILQVTDLRKVPQNGQDRFRLQVSDGTHYFSGMLATQMNPVALSEELQKLCVIQLKEYIMNVVQDKR